MTWFHYLMHKQPSPPWRTVSSDIAHRNPWFVLHRDEVIRPDGEPGQYYHVRSPGAVTVLAIDETDHVLVTRQWIYTHGGAQWRLPAGAIDDTDADPFAAARRELAEETGFRADTLRPLGRISGCDSFSDHVDHVFVATGLTPGPPRPAGGELDLTTHWLDFAEGLALVRRGEMRHAPSAHAFLTVALDRATRD
ncbi:NUDIX domain-containing protein [Actinokineospora iranica]|uniref:8-oxo-dGTP pyrophosphatase MutT, NUDIX family n=1 Tax=Actinokineospora iranica TaxID=1271860 RepID=A0A1G6LEL2_9PSEU|nr:NUDIX hydrolase [Actinokineospora iranica]SDC41681.1 8-oxo-dGTP pyrophosphatase MutT, NUDIX family [Actinokineospora iranica]